MRHISILLLATFIFFNAVPAAYADDKDFFSKSWESISSYFSDDEKDNHDEKDSSDNDKEDHDENRQVDHDNGNTGNTGNTGNATTPPPTIALPLAGNTGNATTPPPTIALPLAVLVEARGAQNTVLAGAATATDSAGNILVVTNDAPVTFPVGITTVTYTATDVYGNIATATQTVTVTDTTAPTLTIQQPAVTVEATAAQMTVTLGVATATDIVDGVLTPTNNAPVTFPLGVTTVTYTATDAAGNAATAQQQVTVQDTTPPVITAPAAVSGASQDGYAVAVAIGLATATDAFNPVAITSNAPATFPIGNTTVTWTATDANNNSSTATQLVTVIDNSIFANLPPDPGAAGKATLEGIDSDNDGVRDDVQRWIVMSYPNSQKTRAALMQATKTMQQFIMSAANPTTAYNIAVQMGKDYECFSYVSPNAYDISSENKAIVLNTYLRTKEWLKANNLLSGNMFSSSPYSQRRLNCNFNPDAMAN